MLNANKVRVMKMIKLFRFYFVVLFCACISCSRPTTGVKLFLAGDSTVQDVNRKDSTKLDWGWGQVLPRFFNENVTVVNMAKGGRSSRSFTEEGRWDKLIAEVNKGDYVMIQFGHNDASVNKPERYTSPEQYRRFLQKFVTDVREKKGIPVLITPVSRRNFKKDEFVHSHGVYPQIVREVAKEMRVPLIDLEEESAELIAGLGPDASRKLFIHVDPGESPAYPDGKHDDTHFSEKGALEMAQLVVNDVKSLRLKPLSRNLLQK